MISPFALKFQCVMLLFEHKQYQKNDIMDSNFNIITEILLVISHCPTLQIP